MTRAARAAIGFKGHIGWAAAVLIAEGPAGPTVMAKERVTMMETFETGAVYHVSQERRLPVAQARDFIDSTMRASVAKAKAAIALLAARHSAVDRAAILVGGGKALPPLEAILRSHPLIHAAEGELYREAVARASEELGMRVLRIPARDLQTRAAKALGMDANALRARLAALGKASGRPWGAEQRECALAAWMALRVEE